MIYIEDWRKNILANQRDQAYLTEIKQFLIERKQAWATIYPEAKNIFAAFDHSAWDDTRVVILGQDPYHGPHQAHGLSFSVQPWTTPPPSLVNIYKQIQSEYPDFHYTNWDLTPRANQWVLLLNAFLTVEAGKPLSHAHIGWQILTDAAIKALSDYKKHVVFMLWGKFAQSKETLINQSKHLVLKAAHPSPFSAYNGFFGCNHFRQCNDYLVSHGLAEINRTL